MIRRPFEARAGEAGACAVPALFSSKWDGTLDADRAVFTGHYVPSADELAGLDPEASDAPILSDESDARSTVLAHVHRIVSAAASPHADMGRRIPAPAPLWGSSHRTSSRDR